MGAIQTNRPIHCLPFLLTSLGIASFTPGCKMYLIKSKSSSPLGPFLHQRLAYWFTTVVSEAVVNQFIGLWIDP